MAQTEGLLSTVFFTITSMLRPQMVSSCRASSLRPVMLILQF